MKSRLYSLACVLYCGALMCWRHVVAHRVHATGGITRNKSAPSASILSSPRALLPARHSRQMREEHGQKQPVSEWHSQQEASLVRLNEYVSPPVCDYSPSFLQQRVDAETDVGCFPHDKDIGSKAREFTQVVTQTVQECLKRCRADPKCNHFTWNKNSKKCHLKSDAPLFYTYKGDMTGPRSCDRSCFVSCVDYNTTPMKTIPWGPHPDSLCQAACWSTDQCKAFVLEDQKCKLYGKGFSSHRTASAKKSTAGPRNFCEHPNDLRVAELAD